MWKTIAIGSKEYFLCRRRVERLNIAGVGCARNRDHRMALLYFDSAVKISTNQSDKKILGKIYANCGLEYDTLRQFSKAIDNLIISAKYAETIQGYVFLAMVYYSIGQAYAGLNLLSDPRNNEGKWSETEFYFKKHAQVNGLPRRKQRGIKALQYFDSASMYTNENADKKLIMQAYGNPWLARQHDETIQKNLLKIFLLQLNWQKQPRIINT